MLLCMFIIAACDKKQSAEECANPLNPNGDSELALLMRKMIKHLETEHAAILANQAAVSYPAEFEKIKTAKRTETKDVSENFQAESDIYLNSLKAYHNSTAENRITNYNNLVNSCVNCHMNECPGPVKTINKLIIAQ